MKEHLIDKHSRREDPAMLCVKSLRRWSKHQTALGIARILVRSCKQAVRKCRKCISAEMSSLTIASGPF